MIYKKSKNPPLIIRNTSCSHSPRSESHPVYYPIITHTHTSYMGVSKNNGTPKSSILIGFSIIFTIHFGGKIPLFLVQHPYIGFSQIAGSSMEMCVKVSPFRGWNCFKALKAVYDHPGQEAQRGLADRLMDLRKNAA